MPAAVHHVTGLHVDLRYSGAGHPLSVPAPTGDSLQRAGGTPD